MLPQLVSQPGALEVVTAPSFHFSFLVHGDACFGFEQDYVLLIFALYILFIVGVYLEQEEWELWE